MALRSLLVQCKLLGLGAESFGLLEVALLLGLRVGGNFVRWCIAKRLACEAMRCNGGFLAEAVS